jgi:hypothetical protein
MPLCVVVDNANIILDGKALLLAEGLNNMSISSIVKGEHITQRDWKIMELSEVM